jgi:hypothetical protein
VQDERRRVCQVQGWNSTYVEFLMSRSNLAHRWLDQ